MFQKERQSSDTNSFQKTLKWNGTGLSSDFHFSFYHQFLPEEAHDDDDDDDEKS
jgi:hypothetical protein